MASWPGTLPDKLQVEGYSEPFADNVIREDMEVGPPKFRRRSTAAPQYIIGVQYLTATQVATLETFYYTTLTDGTVEFDWVHPRTGSSKTFMFTAPPLITAAGGIYYRAEYQFLIKP